MNLQELHTIETTKSSWEDFVNYSIQSDFYREALSKLKNQKDAIDISLMHNLISTFHAAERVYMLDDEEKFKKYASGFVNILNEVKYSKSGYLKENRVLFLQMIKKLLKQQRDKKGNIINFERYQFYKSIVKLCSSLPYVMEVYKKYKSYVFEGEL